MTPPPALPATPATETVEAAGQRAETQRIPGRAGYWEVPRLHTTEESKVNADTIIAALEHYYERTGWLCYPELRIGTGYGKDAEQRIDFWAITPTPSKGLKRIACEVKVSRGDWLKELRQPLKRRHALLLSNEFYIVTPPGLVKADELPVEAGLIEVHDDLPIELSSSFFDHHLHFKHAAPWRDGHPPTWRFVAGLLRRDLRECATALVEETPQ